MKYKFKLWKFHLTMNLPQIFGTFFRASTSSARKFVSAKISTFKVCSGLRRWNLTLVVLWALCSQHLELNTQNKMLRGRNWRQKNINEIQNPKNDIINISLVTLLFSLSTKPLSTLSNSAYENTCMCQDEARPSSFVSSFISCGRWQNTEENYFRKGVKIWRKMDTLLMR